MELASIIAGIPGAAGAVASAIISASKAATIAKDLEAAKAELKGAVGKVETELAAKALEWSRTAATLREDLNRIERRAARPHLISQPSGSFPSVEQITDLGRTVDDHERRLIATEAALRIAEARADKIERIAEELARECREALRKLEIMLATISTRLEERVARRVDRGSHG